MIWDCVNQYSIFSIYGVLPFITFEILRDKPYITASNIILDQEGMKIYDYKSNKSNKIYEISQSIGNYYNVY